MKTKSKSKNKVGRPCKVDWSKVNFLWKNLTDRSIAEKVGCSKVNVFLKRKKLIAKAIEAGKNESLYVCKLPKWTRAKRVEKAGVSTQETPVAQDTAETTPTI